MKFEFTEGQWFDIRKLTDWQKQWCLDNLVILSASKFDFEKGRFHFWIYLEWCYMGYYFGSASERHISSENEITFNDFYWGEEEVTQESIFDNPRWVTSKKNMEFSQGLELILGEDYKVVETISDSDGDKLFKIVNSLGVVRSYHEGHFHKITPEDLKPVVDIEDENSFDNLVFVQPNVMGASVPISKLTPDQLDFICQNFEIESPEKDKTHFTCLTIGTKYFSCPIDKENKSYNLSFNDLFKEVITH